MSIVAEEKLLTIEEFLRLPDNGRPTELVLGRVVTFELHYPYHGYVCSNITIVTGNSVEETQLGRMFVNSGIITHRNPDSVRAGRRWLYQF